MSNVPPRTTRIVGPSGPRDISVLTEIFQRGFRHESESEFHFRPPSATSTEKEEAHGRSRAEWSWVTHDCSSVGLPGPTQRNLTETDDLRESRSSRSTRRTRLDVRPDRAQLSDIPWPCRSARRGNSMCHPPRTADDLARWL